MFCTAVAELQRPPKGRGLAGLAGSRKRLQIKGGQRARYEPGKWVLRCIINIQMFGLQFDMTAWVKAGTREEFGIVVDFVDPEYILRLFANT